jgi:cell division protein FtsW (lipid II flippase)
MIFLKLKIMLVDAWPKLHLFKHDLLLVLFRFLHALVHLVLVLAEVHNTANGWLRLGRHLDQVQILFLRNL